MAQLPDPLVEPKYKAKVLKSERITSDMMEEIREITLSVNDSGFGCKVNQSFGVLVPTPGKDDSIQHRLYSISELKPNPKNKCEFSSVIKRCIYIDAFSGEEVQGVVSNYLCDRREGDEITITGPYPLPFKIPDNPYANMILIGLGTGIAPFRAFIRDLYTSDKQWHGQVRLFYGSKNGLELLYMNNKGRDRAQYYDETTYHALKDLSPRPFWMDSFTNAQKVEDRAEELLDMLWESDTYVYLAGHERILENLELVLSTTLGSKEKWEARKSGLIESGHWIEIIY